MLKFDSAQLGDFFKAALWLGPAKTAETLIPQVNNIIIVRLLGPSAVVIYNLTGKAAEMLVQVVGRFAASFLSGLAHLYGGGEEDKYLKVVRGLFLAISYMAVLGLACVLVFNMDFVRLWVGTDLYGGAILTILFCLYGLIKIIRITLYNIVFSRNEIHITSSASLAEAFIQLVAGIFLGSIWGLKGILIASIFAVAIGAMIQAIALFARTGLVRKFNHHALLRIAIIAVLTFVFATMIKCLWPIAGWQDLFIYTITLLSSGILLVAIVEPAVRSYCTKRVTR